jgi:hypothetical protein
MRALLVHNDEAEIYLRIVIRYRRNPKMIAIRSLGKIMVKEIHAF